MSFFGKQISPFRVSEVGVLDRIFCGLCRIGETTTIKRAAPSGAALFHDFSRRREIEMDRFTCFLVPEQALELPEREQASPLEQGPELVQRELRLASELQQRLLA